MRPSFVVIASLLCFATSIAHADPVPAVALFGEPKYADDFDHLDYVNPTAPKGGALHLAVVGSFDSTNPFIIKGLPASGVSSIYESLMTKTADEPHTSYGLIAKTIDIAPDRSSVTFELRPEAKWHDGQPITPADVIWSFETLRDKGAPFYRTYYKAVKSAAQSGPHSITFTFSRKNDRELPLIMGDLPILPKHFWTDGKHDFAKSNLDIPLGSGPYRVAAIDSGRQVVLTRVKDWWGKDLPINRGQYNFDTVVYDYYRDKDVAFQSFLSGNVDFRQENIAKNWAQGYNHPRVRDGHIVRASIAHDIPTGMQAFAYNTRRPLFADSRVRDALNYAFDFEWSNRQLAFNAYKRSVSYFNNCYLASSGIPAGAERDLLLKYQDQLPPELFTQPYQNPYNTGDGTIRANLRHALDLLHDAGWNLDKAGVLRNAKGDDFHFELLTDNPMFDRWLIPFVQNLRKLGITVRMRSIDDAQYQNRMNDYDFDMTIASIPESLTPGNEQYTYWHSSQANVPGGSNLMGVRNKVVDALVNKVIRAKTQDDLVTATHALDRVLLWNHYVIPQWYTDKFNIAYASWLGRPSINPIYGLPVLETWWDGRLEKPAK